MIYAILSSKAPKKCADKLSALGYRVLALPPFERLGAPVDTHADMLLFFGFGRLFCHEKYYGVNAELIELICKKTGLRVAVSNEHTDTKYPFDVLFNACTVGDKLICNEKTVSKLILTAALQSGYKIINVPQGYTKCSVCVVSDNAIITADNAIAKACTQNGIDVLCVREGYVSLPPYEYGFIGGTSGATDDKVFFCGSLDTHPDCESILTFCKKHNKKAISLSAGKLQDIGSILFI